MVPQKRGAQVFNGVDLRSIHDRLMVGAGHTDVEGGDPGVSRGIPSGYIDAGKEFQMIDSEACDLVHRWFLSFL